VRGPANNTWHRVWYLCTFKDLPSASEAYPQSWRNSVTSAIPADRARCGNAACADSVAGTVWAADGTGRWPTSSAARAAETLSPRPTCSAAGDDWIWSALRSSCCPRRLRYDLAVPVNGAGPRGSSATKFHLCQYILLWHASFGSHRVIFSSRRTWTTDVLIDNILYNIVHAIYKYIYI